MREKSVWNSRETWFWPRTDAAATRRRQESRRHRFMDFLRMNRFCFVPEAEERELFSEFNDVSLDQPRCGGVRPAQEECSWPRLSAAAASPKSAGGTSRN